MEPETVILNEGAETPKRYTLHVAHVDGGCESSHMCTAFGILIGVRRMVRGHRGRGRGFQRRAQGMQRYKAGKQKNELRRIRWGGVRCSDISFAF